MSRQLLGRISLLQDKPAAAIRQASAILARPETDLLTVDFLKAGLLYADSGEIQQARDVLRRLNAIRSQNPSGWNNRFAEELEGEIAMAEGDSGRAVTAFLRAIAAVPDPALHRALALAYQRQKQWEPARQEWEQFIAARGAVLQNEFPPDLVAAHLNLARLFVRRGETRTAEEHYRKVLELWSDADQMSLRRAAAQELRQLARAKTE
jgi:tetratricopeptide (TPR) repeat protein